MLISQSPSQTTRNPDQRRFYSLVENLGVAHPGGETGSRKDLVSPSPQAAALSAAVITACRPAHAGAAQSFTQRVLADAKAFLVSIVIKVRRCRGCLNSRAFETGLKLCCDVCRAQ